MNGYLNILKPPGMTSAAVVSRIRRMTGEKRVGHAGTLDPDAAGVLPVMVGRATRLFDYLVDKEKSYIAEAAFGQATDTQDASGRVTETGGSYPELQQVREAAQKLTGDIWQRPGAYSAIKQDGEALYKKARRGETVEAPERLVHIEKIDIRGEMPNHGVLMRVDCGRGTYIRSLCSDLGRLTGCPAHMRFLLRCRSGAFTIEDAMTLEEAADLADAGLLAERLLPLDWPLQHLPRYDAPPEMAKKVQNGMRLPCGRDIPEDTPVRVYLEGRFCGMAQRLGGMLVWRMVLPE